MSTHPPVADPGAASPSLAGVRPRSIVVATPWYPTAANPVAGAFCRDAVTALSSAGHRVRVVHVSPEAGRDGRGRARPARYPRTRRGALLLGVGWAAAAVQAEARAARPDLLHAHVTLPVGLAAAMVGRALRLPVVLTEHTGPFESQLGSGLRERLARWTLANVAAVVPVGRALLARMRPFLSPAVPVRVIPNPVDTEAFAGLLRPRPGRDRLLFVGRLAPEKRLGDLLEALSQLRARRPGVTLRLVGDGPARGELAGRVEELGLGGFVSFAGALPRAGAAEAMAAADVVVLPSQHETFGVALVEGLAAGRPVVATACGGPEEIVAPSVGELVPVGEPAALAGAIDRVLGRAFDPSSLSAYAGERWGFGPFAAAQSALYDTLLAGGGDPAASARDAVG